MFLSGGNIVRPVAIEQNTTQVRNNVGNNSRNQVERFAADDAIELGAMSFAEAYERSIRTGPDSMGCPADDAVCKQIAQRYSELTAVKASLTLPTAFRGLPESPTRAQARHLLQAFEDNCLNSDFANRYQQAEEDFLRSLTLLGLILVTETLVRSESLAGMICPDGQEPKKNYDDDLCIDLTLELMNIFSGSGYEQLKALIQRHGLANVGISFWQQAEYNSILMIIQNYLCE